MKSHGIVALLIIVNGLWFGSMGMAQEVKNGDFSTGTAHWQGNFRIVYLDASGAINEEMADGLVPAAKVELKPHEWTHLKQEMHPTTKEKSVAATIVIVTLAEFAPAPTSETYARGVFKEGGQYSWSDAITPKCDFLLTLADWGYYYNLYSLKPYGTTKTFHVKFTGLEGESRYLDLAFPPGKGAVLVKRVF